MQALDEACSAVGGQGELAARLSSRGPRVTPQAISYWRRSGVIPADRGGAIEHESGVRAEALCPQVEWIRDAEGVLEGYRPPMVPVRVPRKAKARKAARKVGLNVHRRAPALRSRRP